MDATREQLFSIYKLFDPYRLYICSSLISLVHNKFAVGCLLCVVLLILNYRLFRYSHNVKPKLIPNRFRRRDKFLYYGHKLLRSFKLYTSLVNRRRTMLKLANKRRILRKQTNKTLMLKGTQLPRFLLEVDSESVRSLQSNNVFSPEIQYLLKNVRVFGHFEKPVILNLCKFVYTKFVPAGSYLFRIGDLDDSIYVVEKGQLQVILTENQKCRYSIKTCTSSDSIFSLLSIADYLAGVKRRFGTVSCKAVVDSTLIALPFKAFTSVFAEFPQSLVRFVQTIMLRFRRITFMTLHDHLGLTAELMHSENEPCERFEHELHKEKLRESFVLHRGTNDDSLKVPTDEYDIKSIASDFDIAFARANLSKASTKVHKVELRERSDSESDHSEYAEFNNESTDLVSDVQKEIESFLQLQTVKLGQMLTIHTVSKNTQLFTEGQPCEKIIYLVKGSIVATCSYLSKTNESGKVNQNKEKPMFTVQPKQFVGILPILTGESSLYTVSAKEKCIIGVIRKEDIYEILQQEPLAVLPLMQSKTRRISNFVRRLDFGMEWTFFEAGKAIYRQGCHADNVYIILNGRIRRIYTDPEHSQVKHLLGEHGRGETLGFLEVFMDIPRQSTVMAIRDTETAQISSGLLNYLRSVYPSVLTNFMHMTRQTILGSFKPSLNVFDDGSQFVNGFSGIGGVQLTTDFLGKRNQNLSTVAVFPINDKVQIDHFTESLANALQSYGSVIRLTRQSILDRLGSSALASINEHRLLAWLSQQEEQHRLVIYQCSSKFNTWSRRCVRQADCVLAVGIFWTSPEVTNIERKIQEHSVRAQKELVLLHDLKDGRHPRGTANWLRTRTWCSSHHHIRCPSYFFTDPISCSTSRSSMDILMSSIYTKHNTSSSASEISDSTSVCDKMGDMHRLARFLTGRSVGLALGGGGAKGIAHIGIIEAMMDKKIPIDLVGGTSIGSFVGGLFASRLCVDYCSYQTKRLSDEVKSLTNKILDLTYPVVAMFTGSVFNNIIENIFGDVQIEDLWIPYFCVTTDISESKMRIHTSGKLWPYVRASMSLSGYFPPLCDPSDGHLLVDGGYINNLPADIIRRMGAYEVIAVDVGSRDETEFTNYGDSVSGWWLLWKKINPWASAVKIPDMAEIQTRLAYVSCQQQLEFVKQMIRCEYIRPPIDRFGSLQFGAFQELREIGYTYGKAVFHNWPISSMPKESSNESATYLPTNSQRSSILSVSSDDDIFNAQNTSANASSTINNFDNFINQLSIEDEGLTNDSRISPIAFVDDRTFSSDAFSIADNSSGDSQL